MSKFYISSPQDRFYPSWYPCKAQDVRSAKIGAFRHYKFNKQLGHPISLLRAPEIVWIGEESLQHPGKIIMTHCQIVGYGWAKMEDVLRIVFM